MTGGTASSVRERERARERAAWPGSARPREGEHERAWLGRAFGWAERGKEEKG
jgi:hypothetical protein